MDELRDQLTNYIIASKELNLLIDTILDNSTLSYDEKTLRIDDEAPIFSIIKAFNYDEYNIRLEELKIQAEEKRNQKGKREESV